MQTIKQIFWWPVVMGLLILIGLVVALLADGLLEQLAMAAMALPIIVMIHIYLIRGFFHH